MLAVKTSALPGGAGGEAVVEEMEYLEIADQAPLGFIDKTRRNFASDALDVQIRTQTLQDICHEVKVVGQVQAQKILWYSRILLFNARPADNLQLMELHRMQRKRIDEGALVHKH